MNRSTRRVVTLVATLALAVTAVACSGDDDDGSEASPDRTGDAASVAADVPGLPPAAVEVMDQELYDQARWLVRVEDVASGEVLISLDADKLAEPGSVVKTYSAGAVWLALGPDSTVTTPVKRRGEVAGTTLDGDLVLVAAGDLTLGGRTAPDGSVAFTDMDHNDANELPGATLTPQDPLAGLDELATQVAASGITEVTGDVVVDDRLWEAHAIGNGPVSPIVVNNNLIDLTTTPTEPGRPAEVEMRPVVAPWTVRNEVGTVDAGGDTAVEVSSPDERTIVVSGTIAADADPAVGVHAFADPARFARTAFVEALERAGVAVAADPVAPNAVDLLPARDDVEELPTVAALESLPLEEEVTYVLKVSYNRGAETFVCRLAVSAGSRDCEDGLAAAADVWREAGLDTTGASLLDGSGLDGNLVTPTNQVALQRIMARRDDGTRWRDALPVLGVDGSLAMVQTDSPAAGKVHAKTGTLGAADLFNGRLRLGTKALGGTMEAASGRRLAFAVIVTNSTYADIEGVFAANDDVGRVAAAIQQAY